MLPLRLPLPLRYYLYGYLCRKWVAKDWLRPPARSFYIPAVKSRSWPLVALSSFLQERRLSRRIFSVLAATDSRNLATWSEIKVTVKRKDCRRMHKDAEKMVELAVFLLSTCCPLEKYYNLEHQKYLLEKYYNLEHQKCCKLKCDLSKHIRRKIQIKNN